MRLLFPADPARPGRIDPEWAEESEAAASDGIASGVVDLVALERGDGAGAVKRVRAGNGEHAEWRGPILNVEARNALASALAERGLLLVP